MHLTGLSEKPLIRYLRCDTEGSLVPRRNLFSFTPAARKHRFATYDRLLLRGKDGQGFHQINAAMPNPVSVYPRCIGPKTCWVFLAQSGLRHLHSCISNVLWFLGQERIVIIQKTELREPADGLKVGRFAEFLGWE